MSEPYTLTTSLTVQEGWTMEEVRRTALDALQAKAEREGLRVIPGSFSASLTFTADVETQN